ncbi:zinc finger protein 239-like [Periplaneta americana]|uniref:zinc finger protein 239-like n=1 Tax=Periplaneta americana TaxID=6978 RepID=UPI0037E7D66F
MYTYKMEENRASSEEGNLSHLQVTGIKTECVDQSYDIKSEIKVEDITPVPITFPMVKTEVDEEFFDVDGVQHEQKVEIFSEEDEVFTESFVDHDEKRVIRERTGIGREEDNLTECGSNRPDCSNLSDVGRNMCNEVFVTIHNREKPLKCDVCGNCFTSSSNLKRHTLIHSGEKPFQCDICGKCFLRLADLNRHVRSHTGEKPFKCAVCGKCFSESSNLKKHARTHTVKGYSNSCYVESFSRSWDLYKNVQLEPPILRNDLADSAS